MKNHVCLFLIMAGIAVGSAVRAFAEEDGIEFSVGLGARTIDSEIKDYIEDYEGAAELNLGLAGPLTKEALQWEVGLGAGAGGESNNKDDETAIFSFVEGRFGLAVKKAFNDKFGGFVDGGVVYTYAKLKSDSNDAPREIDASDTGIGPYAGAGLRFRFTSLFGLSTGLNYTYSKVDLDGVDANAGGVRIYVNAVFHFI